MGTKTRRPATDAPFTDSMPTCDERAPSMRALLDRGVRCSVDGPERDRHRFTDLTPVCAAPQTSPRAENSTPYLDAAAQEVGGGSEGAARRPSRTGGAGSVIRGVGMGASLGAGLAGALESGPALGAATAVSGGIGKAAAIGGLSAVGGGLALIAAAKAAKRIRDGAPHVTRDGPGGLSYEDQHANAQARARSGAPRRDHDQEARQRGAAKAANDEHETWKAHFRACKEDPRWGGVEPPDEQCRHLAEIKTRR